MNFVLKMMNFVFKMLHFVLKTAGGGSKGLIPAMIMQRIEQLCSPHQIHELFDVVAGTSTGGILALVNERRSERKTLIESRLRVVDFMLKNDDN